MASTGLNVSTILSNALYFSFFFFQLQKIEKMEVKANKASTTAVM